MKKFLSLLMMTLLCVSAWAAEVYYTLDGTQTGGTNGYGTESEITQDGMTWKVMGNTEMSPWRIGGKSLTDEDRPVYSTTEMGSAITNISLEVGTASNITVNSLTLIVASDADFTNQLDVVTGNFVASSTIDFAPTSGTEWAKNAFYKFVFNVSVSGTSNKFVQFVNAKFYAEAGEDPVVADPVITFSPEKAYEGEEVTATITCETEGASIMYALNDGEFQTYSEPLTLTETTTVHAKAVLSDPTTTAPVESAVTTKTITFGKGVQNIAEMNALPNGTEFKLMGNATVVYVNGGYLYIMDETGYSLIYGSTVDGIEAGNTIFNLVAKVSIYKGLFEVANATYDFDPTATEVAPNEYALSAVTAEKMNEYIILKGVALSELSSKDFTMTDASGASLAGYQRFDDVEYPTDLEATYDVVGFGSVYNDNVQFYPISFTKTVIPEPVITVTPDFGEYETAQTVFVTVENMPEGAVVMYNFVEAEPTQGAPRKAEGDITWNEYDATKGILVEKSGLLTIAVNDANGEEITSIEGEYTITGGTTAVENINAGKAVAGVRYYNAAGQQAANAFQGVNIVVTTYSDGTQSVSKIVR